VEMEKTIKELKFVIENRKKENPTENFNILAVGLSARKNLCIHPSVSKM
jgi:DNA excision repair protein ERCC-2